MRYRMEVFYDSARGWVLAHLPVTIQGVLAAVATLVVILILHRITKRIIVGALRRQHRTDAQIAQVVTMWKYTFMLGGIVFVIVSMSASLAAMGITVAFVSMILGWSLQRPVTGVAAWLMVMIKKPFRIGDRVIIQGVRGDVLDISPTHILLGEVGGTIGGEEPSNRGILIPNAVLFDQMVINYAVTQESKYILDEVPVRVSYDSDYKLAEQTLVDAARAVTADIIKETGKEPTVRSEFFDSGIMMRVRYQTIAVERQRISSDMVGKIVEVFGNSNDLGFAYPHTAVEYKPVDEKCLPPAFRSVGTAKQS
jgi:small-conductance mechanosensitive channel